MRVAQDRREAVPPVPVGPEPGYAARDRIRGGRLAHSVSGPLATTRDGVTSTDPTLANHPLRSQVLAHEAVHSEQFRAWRAGTPTGSINELEREAEAGQGARRAGVPFTVQHGAPAGLELHYDSPDAISGAAPIASPAPDGEAAPAHTGPGWQLLNEVGLVRVDESTASLKGARLRPEPTAEGPRAAEFVTLPENTHVHVVSQRSEPNQQGWHYVVVTDGPFLGRTGYVKEYLIRTGLPDPLAIEYYIETPNLRLQWLVENHRHFADYDIKTGDDARTLVMAVYLANQEHGRENGVYLNHEKLREAKDPGWWEGAKDKLDEYRRVLRPILQAVELKQGAKIWLPGPGYVDRLKDRKIIPTRPAWKNAFIAVGKGIAGFVSGLIQGFVGSFVDLVVGIWDLVHTIFTTVRDLFSGELLRKGREVYAAIDKYLSGKTPGEVLSDLLNALSTAAGEMWTDFGRRWTADNLFDRWNFRGRVIGYLAAEVLMAVISGGASLAAKLLSKLGKVGKVLAEILAKILRKIDDLLDVIPGRKRSKHEAGKHGDGKDSKGKQLPFAIAAASLIAETNDRSDTPTPVLKAQLMLTLQAKYRWITGFGAERHGPRVYTIVMFGSRHVVDPHYTTKDDEPGDPPGTATATPKKETIEDFKARGGEIKRIPEGQGVTKPRGLQPDKTTARPKDVSPTDELRAFVGDGPQSSAISEGSVVRIGAARAPRHHVFPQESRSWFEGRGLKGDHDIHNYTIELPKDFHEAIHGGGNWKLARKIEWEKEWNRNIMARLITAERRKGSQLTRDEIIAEAKSVMKDYKIEGEFVHYKRGK